MADGEVKKFLDDISLAIDAIKAKRTAAGRYGMDKTSLDEMDGQIAQLSAIKLEALMELGGRIAAMETVPNNQYTVDLPQCGKTKTEQLSELGITPQRANENEKMYKNKEVVHQYIEDSLAKGKAPSQRGALSEIKKQEDCVSVDESGKVKDQKKNRGFDQEMRKQKKLVDEVIAEMYSPELKPFTIEMLEGDIEINGQNYIDMLRATLVDRSTLLVGENRKRVAKKIDHIITEIQKIRRLVE